MCVSVCAHVLIYSMCMWKPKGNFEYHSSGASNVFFKTGSLTGLEFFLHVGEINRLANPRERPSSASPALEVQASATTLSFFMWVLGSKFCSRDLLCLTDLASPAALVPTLQAKHFTKRASSSAQVCFAFLFLIIKWHNTFRMIKFSFN